MAGKSAKKERANADRRSAGRQQRDGVQGRVPSDQWWREGKGVRSRGGDRLAADVGGLDGQRRGRDRVAPGTDGAAVGHSDRPLEFLAGSLTAEARSKLRRVLRITTRVLEYIEKEVL